MKISIPTAFKNCKTVLLFKLTDKNKLFVSLADVSSNIWDVKIEKTVLLFKLADQKRENVNEVCRIVVGLLMGYKNIHKNITTM